jgi:putative ABC transport system permease protein
MSGDGKFAGLRRAFSLPSSARSVQREIDDEIRFHLESRVAELIARGLSPTAAREQALQHYGDIVASRVELARVDRGRLSRERWSAWLDAFRQDAAFALRAFKRQPGFALGAVLVLALGIGANATMFGVIDRLLLRPPAQVADPARVMMIRYLRTYDGKVSEQDALSFPMYLDLRNTAGAFGGVAAYSDAELAVGRGLGARRVSGQRVSAGYFQTLGVHPRLGRFFGADEDVAPSPNVAVISHSYWQNELGGQNSVIGQTLPIGDTKFTIVGVAPAGFTGVQSGGVDVWIPITAGVTVAQYEGWKQSRNGFWLLSVVRLAPTVSREAASAAASRVLQASLRNGGMSEEKLAAQRPGIGFISILPREAHAGDLGARVAILLGGVSLLVLLIACANVANLQLARGIARRREIAIRVALGVSRGRLVGQLLTESTVLAVAGGVAAIFVAHWGSLFVRRVLLDTSDAGASPIDGRVLVYTMVVAIAVGLMSGMVPAIHAARSTVSAELKSGAREGGSHRTRARTILLVVQTMLSVLLLVGTGLFVRSLQRINTLPLGLEPARTLVATVQTSGVSYTSRELAALYARLLEVAQASPGVHSAALATSLPFNTSWAVRVRVPGRDSLPRVREGGPYGNEVTPGYFATVGTRILQGRAFTDADHGDASRVVVINESLAKLWWPNENAIGKCMMIGNDPAPCSQIVGIAENSRRQSLIEDENVQYFIPLAQSVRGASATPVLLVRPKAEATTAAEPLRRQLQSAAPNLPYIRVIAMEELVSPQKRSWRLGATMFALFGALALILAAIGLYSVLAYDVAQRTREFGVRVALGARGADVMGMVLTGGMRTALVGGAAGSVATLLAGRWLAPLLFQTSPRDPLVFSLVFVVVITVALLAALVPARRALRVDPIVALRAD